MQLYPAIDLLAGRCVRLYQGDYDLTTVYGDARPAPDLTAGIAVPQSVRSMTDRSVQ